MTIKEFIDSIKPKALDIYRQWGVLPSITVSQAILESSKDGIPGASGLTKKANNLFGVKGKGTAGSIQLPTKEQDANGKEYTILADFKVYNNWSESLDDYGKLLGRADRYEGVRTASDYKTALSALQSSGYATDKSYSGKLSKIIIDNQLFKLDSEVGRKVPEGTKESPGSALDKLSTIENPLDWKGSIGNWLMKAGFILVGAIVLILGILFLFGDTKETIKEVI